MEDVPGIADHNASFWNKVFPIDIIFGYCMRDAKWGDGVPALNFLAERIDVREMLLILESGESVHADDSVEFGLSFTLDFWV